MTLTAAQIDALETLAEVFDHSDVTAKDISPYYANHYAEYAQNYATYAVQQYARHKVASSIDWEEVKRKLEEERLAKLAERADAVRDNVVLSALSGLVHKAYRCIPGVSVTLDVDADGASLLVWDHENDYRVFSMDYYKDSDKGEYTLETRYVEDRYTDDVKVLSGNQSPKQQIKGLSLIHEALDELAKENNDDDDN